MQLEYAEKGSFMLKNTINEGDIQRLINSLNVFETDINHYGIRDLMNKVPCIRDLAFSVPLLSIAQKILGKKAQPIRAVFFDKLPGANWNVAWHQDTSIAVKAKADIPGFSAWRKRQGVMHVEPPEEYLASIVTLRVHLDLTNTETGVLRVIPGSHRNGWISSRNILAIVEKSAVKECTANSGDVLVMNPLLFHASRKATQPQHRRIIHLEYSAMSLPAPLEWYEGG